MKNLGKDMESTSAELEIGHASDLKEGNVLPIDQCRSASDLAVESAENLQAENIHLLDVRGLSDFTDYFVILTATSSRHLRAVASDIEFSLKSEGHVIHHKEGDHTSGWTLLDYGNLIVHLFAPEYREFYDLESAWTEAKTLRIIQ